MPLIRVFIKKRLALVAFLTYYFSSQAGGPLWHLNTRDVFSIPIEGQPLIAGNSSIFGCKCSGWKEGVVGTLSCCSKKESDSLKQEFITLNSVLGGLFCGEQTQELAGSERDLLSSFSRLIIANPNSKQDIMDHANENVGLADLKKNLRRCTKWWLLESWTVKRLHKK